MLKPEHKKNNCIDNRILSVSPRSLQVWRPIIYPFRVSLRIWALNTCYIPLECILRSAALNSYILLQGIPGDLLPWKPALYISSRYMLYMSWPFYVTQRSASTHLFTLLHSLLQSSCRLVLLWCLFRAAIFVLWHLLSSYPVCYKLFPVVLMNNNATTFFKSAFSFLSDFSFHHLSD